MATNQQRREAAKRKLNRQLERRAQQTKRNRVIGVAATIGAVALVAGLAMFLATRGGDDDVEPGAHDETPLDETEPEPTVEHGVECTAEDFTVEGEPDEPPQTTVPDDCDAPAELLIEDLVEGSGDKVEDGSTIEVHYQLVDFPAGAPMDSSWERGEPFQVTVGDGQVIQGWEEGVLGMQEGTRRLLVVPPELGYGDGTLVFVIDALKVT